MKKLLIMVSPISVVLFVVLWISEGLEFAFVLYCALLQIVAMAFVLAKWIEFVETHTKD